MAWVRRYKGRPATETLVRRVLGSADWFESSLRPRDKSQPRAIHTNGKINQKPIAERFDTISVSNWFPLQNRCLAWGSDHGLSATGRLSLAMNSVFMASVASYEISISFIVGRGLLAKMILG
ncbi:hypothetical protein BD410DRAFT_450759 [Rickenella mellea]|uniref:Uncharacterized protein n=1 Tax=Rickenella mellea TaxID=50990 RepID=A0A4Y7PVQ0_9AGAM|nr:hypothetical protein BD410DRAFT_450759 [Rickenella mellea]